MYLVVPSYEIKMAISFLLRPQHGGKDIAIPCGKTTIGRGPFLGVTDKRVSRSHAEVQLSDGKLTILPLHVNPTFHKTGVNKKFVALKKNESYVLHKGDAISLLPDDICFTVILEECASDSDMTKKTNNAENKLGNNYPSSVVNVVENCYENLSKTKKQLSESFLEEFLDNRTSIKSVQAASTQADKETGNPSTQFPETLSLSSLVSHLLILNDKVNSFRKNREQSECSFGHLCLLYVLLYRRLLGRLLLPRSEWSQTIYCRLQFTKQLGASCSKLHQLSSENCSDDGNELPSLPTGAGLGEEDELPAAIKDKVGSSMLGNDQRTASKLPQCPYGSKCYRKNPTHFEEYSHNEEDDKTDNNDSGDRSDGAADDRPDCPYGTSCYRKNPQHKRDYNHTKSLGRPKRQGTKHKSVLDNESDEDGPNTYDYNDSFLNDEELSESSYSAGSADDSDWQPQGEDRDDDEENVDELLSDARGFLRSKNMAKPV
ncbi:PREDICTED: aprataxin and PNK-like factor [Acropora digitifera]|uniref:aprataxin and PNK-like factor n=1 Tax=Acropora digitifera TaxID=70779 RepID=UPI000779FA6D|nr:PREDICTED: aprataxin and PNK-like factor [Acropora digitifera]